MGVIGSKPESKGNSLRGSLAGGFQMAIGLSIFKAILADFLGTHVLLLGNGKRLGVIFQF